MVTLVFLDACGSKDWPLFGMDLIFGRCFCHDYIIWMWNITTPRPSLQNDGDCHSCPQSTTTIEGQCEDRQTILPCIYYAASCLCPKVWYKLGSELVPLSSLLCHFKWQIAHVLQSLFPILCQNNKSSKTVCGTFKHLTVYLVLSVLHKFMVSDSSASRRHFVASFLQDHLFLFKLEIVSTRHSCKVIFGRCRNGHDTANK